MRLGIALESKLLLETWIGKLLILLVDCTRILALTFFRVSNSIDQIQQNSVASERLWKLLLHMKCRSSELVTRSTSREDKGQAGRSGSRPTFYSPDVGIHARLSSIIELVSLLVSDSTNICCDQLPLTCVEVFCTPQRT